MELVRHTIEFIRKKPYGNNLLIRVKDEVQLVIESTQNYEAYDRQKIINENKKNTVRHAYFREYLALQHLCLLILQHQKHQIGSGSRQIYGILFDGAWLWEEYVASLIDEMFYHPMNKGGKGAQRLFAGNVGLIYPDFISRDNEKESLLMPSISLSITSEIGITFKCWLICSGLMRRQDTTCTQMPWASTILLCG